MTYHAKPKITSIVSVVVVVQAVVVLLLTYVAWMIVHS